ncbi:MAG: hypothetical protein ACREQL_04355 [Candidatus Binatia bacterium]
MRRDDQMLAIRVARLEAGVQGVVVGLMVGLAVFLATNWLVLRGGPVVGPHLALLSQFFLGYEVSFVGSLVGFAWGAAYGFVAGYAVSVLYNRIAARAGTAGRS